MFGIVAVAVVYLHRCKTAATVNCCFDYCSSSQTIDLDSIGCGKLERDFEMTRMMILKDFVVMAVEAMRVSCVTFAAEMNGVGTVAVADASRSSGGILQ